MDCYLCPFLEVEFSSIINTITLPEREKQKNDNPKDKKGSTPL